MEYLGGTRPGVWKAGEKPGTQGRGQTITEGGEERGSFPSLEILPGGGTKGQGGRLDRTQLRKKRETCLSPQT